LLWVFTEHGIAVLFDSLQKLLAPPIPFHERSPCRTSFPIKDIITPEVL